MQTKGGVQQMGTFMTDGPVPDPDARSIEALPGEDVLSGPDRRRFPRVLVDLEVDYQSEETYLFAYITDISLRGIFIRTNDPEAPGTRLNLRFTVPGEPDPFALEGVVVWVNPYRPGDPASLNPGMGVKFIGLETEDQRRITGLVRTFAYLDRDSTDDGDDGGDVPPSPDSSKN